MRLGLGRALRDARRVADARGARVLRDRAAVAVEAEVAPWYVVIGTLQETTRARGTHAAMALLRRQPLLKEPLPAAPLGPAKPGPERLPAGRPSSSSGSPS